MVWVINFVVHVALKCSPVITQYK